MFELDQTANGLASLPMPRLNRTNAERQLVDDAGPDFLEALARGLRVIEAFRDVMHLNVAAVDARERFLAKLEGISDPEEKRIRIGHEFIAPTRPSL